MPKKLQLLVPLVGPEGPQGPQGETGSAGKDGATFKPSVTEDGVLSWTNDKGLANPTPVTIKNSGIHIGAEEPTNPNANIWILPDEEVEEPTDDTVYIPAPEAASVGQTIVVKAVDENGRPTEWEATDLPSGGSNELRHIATITLEEDTRLVYLDKDSDGNPFSLSEFGINLYSVGAASNTTEGYFKVLINTPTYNAGLVAIDIRSAIRKDGSTQSRIIKTTGGHYLHSITAAEDNKNSFDENMRLIGKLGSNSTPIFIQNSYGVGADKITSLLFGSDSASTLLGVGTKIAIWGC